MKRIKVNVTRADIKHGKQHSCRHCPVALALGRAIKQSVRVAPTFYNRGTSVTMYFLPKKAHRFIQRFDASKPVKPFSFFVTI